MRVTRVAYIVTILLGIIQPLEAQVSKGLTGEILNDHLAIVRTTIEGERRSIELTTLPDEHSFYPDILIPSETAPRVLLVVPFSVPEELLTAVLELRNDPSVAILVVAPRREIRNRASAALAPPGVADSVPRVLIRAGEQSEWFVSVPGNNAPLWLVRSIRNAKAIPLSAARLNISYLGFGRPDPELRLLLESRIPAARLDLAYTGIDEERAPDLVNAIRHIGTMGVDPANRAEDRSFLILPIPRIPILSEPVLVWSIVVVAVGMIVYAVARPRQIHRYGRAIRYQVWLLLLLFLILWLSLVAANLALRLLLRIPTVADRPLILAVGKLAVGLIVLALLFRVLHPRLRRPSTAFTGAAILFLVLGAVVSALFSLPLGVYFVLMTMFGFLFSLTPRLPLKALALLLATLPGVYLILSLISIADAGMTRAFLTPPVYREIYTAIFVYPILLMFFRLEILTREIPLLVVTTMLSLVGLAIIIATVITTSKDAATLRVTLRESYTGPDTGEVTLASSSQLVNPIEVELPGDSAILCDQAPCTREVPDRIVPFEITIERSQLLDRTGISWSVAFDEAARSMQVRVDSDRDVQLYASDIPSRINAVGSTARRFLLLPGLYPPNPVGGEVVVRTDGQPTRLTVTVSAEFEQEGVLLRSEGQEVILVSHVATWSESSEVEIDAP